MPGKPRAESRFVFGWEADGSGWSQTCGQESWSGEEEGVKARRAMGMEKGDIRGDKNAK